MELLLVTPRPEVWNECLPVFQRGGNTLQQAASLEDAAPIIRDTPPVLAILDLGIEGKALRQAVIDIMMINASVHTAVVSDMDPDEFHEATEGLGILMPLPTSPMADDTERLLKALAGVLWDCRTAQPTAKRLMRNMRLRSRWGGGRFSVWGTDGRQRIAVSAPTRRDIFEPDSYPP